jgi:hypothetical protein
MSKTTKKLGKPLYTIYLGGTSDVKPSPSLLRNWARLDHYAMQDYLKPYDSLTDAQKIQVHFNLNSGIYREQEKKERSQKKEKHNDQNRANQTTV